MAKKTVQPAAKAVDESLLEKALAKSVCTGDFINFKLLFASFSPARASSLEQFETEKYAYLLPDESLEASDGFRTALEAVRRPETWSHVLRELAEKRPPQMPSDLILPLADNAVRAGRYSTAAQAYEMLRIRRGMQDMFYKQADEASAAGDMTRAARGYLIGARLNFDYAAFPEPLPQLPDYQTRALMIHGKYPTRPEDFVSLQPDDALVDAMLTYLFDDADAAARVREHPLERRLAVLRALVECIDPDWSEFTARFQTACTQTEELAQRMQHAFAEGAGANGSLKEEIEGQQAAEPMDITVTLLGRRVENGEWWQYLKELAYAHPAAIFFISRQEVAEKEILMPRFRKDSRLPAILGLSAAQSAGAMPEIPV